MSATILAFKPRQKAEAPAKAPAPMKLDITEFECAHLDRVIDRAVHVLDVVNSGPELIKSFLRGDTMIGAKVLHGGREYELRLSLAEINQPRLA